MTLCSWGGALLVQNGTRTFDSRENVGMTSTLLSSPNAIDCVPDSVGGLHNSDQRLKDMRKAANSDVSNL